MRLSEKWIISDPKILGGKPVIRGTRISVSFILKCLASGMTVDDILKEWPELEREDIYQALRYAAWAIEERVVLLEGATGK